MTAYDDGTPVQPGDYVMRLPVRIEATSERMDADEVIASSPREPHVFLGYIDTFRAYGATFEPVAEPRPPLPTHLGAVVWVGDLPYFLGLISSRPQWLSTSGLDADTDWLAEQDWTTTPPEGHQP